MSKRKKLEYTFEYVEGTEMTEADFEVITRTLADIIYKQTMKELSENNDDTEKKESA